MPVELATGSPWSHPAGVRVNTINCVGVMGTGVAAQFRDRYPEVDRVYRRACKDGRLRPGTLQLVEAKDGTTVVNFPTKDHWRDPSAYRYLVDGLKALRLWLTTRCPPDAVITIPALGCNNGGLDWPVVRRMVEDALAECPQRVLLFPPLPSYHRFDPVASPQNWGMYKHRRTR